MRDLVLVERSVSAIVRDRLAISGNSLRIPTKKEACNTWKGRNSGAEKGVITKGVFSFEKSPQSLYRISRKWSFGFFFIFQTLGGSLESPDSLQTLEKGTSLKRPLLQETPFSEPEKRNTVEGTVKRMHLFYLLLRSFC